MAYKHGAYGEIGDSKVASTTQADVVAAYIGTAPVNLIRGYADMDLVNMPIKLTDMGDARASSDMHRIGPTSHSAKPSPSILTTPSGMWARSTS